MKTKRSIVYRAIDSERDYQENLARNEVKFQNPLEQLALIDVLSAKMKEEFYNKPGQPSTDFMRKIAGVAVRCMEQHGVAERMNYKG